MVALSTRRLLKRGTIKVREAVLGAGSRVDANVRLHRWAPNSVQKVPVIHSTGLRCIAHACGASTTSLLAMGEELEQLASQIRAELQAVRKLEEQIDPEEVDGLQVGALLTVCVACALLCIINHVCC